MIAAMANDITIMLKRFFISDLRGEYVISVLYIKYDGKMPRHIMYANNFQWSKSPAS